MTSLDLLIVVVFSVIVIITGLSFTGSGKNMQSFFAAGGAIPWYINGLSLFMGFFSAGTFVVWGSIAYSQGFVAIAIQWTMAFAGFAVGLFIAPAWHKNRALTAASYINRRLGSFTQKTYTYLFLFISLFTTGSFLYPVARIVQVASGYPIELCILLLGGASVLYVAAGGLWAVVVTDVLQFVILFSVVVVVALLSWFKVDGLSGLTSVVPADFFNLVNQEFSLTFILAFALYNLFFLGGNWAYVQRYTSTAKPADARKSAWLFGTLYLVSPVLWMLPPMLYRAINNNLTGLEAEGAYLLICKEVLPSGMLGLMIGGMVFATASSLNSILNVSAGVITQDVYPYFFGKASNRRLINVARISTILLGVLAIAVALMVKQMGGIVNVVITIAALTGVPLYLPVVWSLFSRRQTGMSVLFATVGGLSINLLLKFGGPFIGLNMSRAGEMLIGVLSPLFILVSFELYFLLTGKYDPKYDTYRTEIDATLITNEADAKVSQQENRYGKKVIGISVSISSAIIVILGLFATHGRWIIAVVGLLLLMAGLFIWLKNTKKRYDKGSRV